VYLQRIFPLTASYVGSITGTREKCTVSPRTIGGIEPSLFPLQTPCWFYVLSPPGNRCPKSSRQSMVVLWFRSSKTGVWWDETKTGSQSRKFACDRGNRRCRWDAEYSRTSFRGDNQ